MRLAYALYPDFCSDRHLGDFAQGSHLRRQDADPVCRLSDSHCSQSAVPVVVPAVPVAAPVVVPAVVPAVPVVVPAAPAVVPAVPVAVPVALVVALAVKLVVLVAPAVAPEADVAKILSIYPCKSMFKKCY